MNRGTYRVYVIVDMSAALHQKTEKVRKESYLTAIVTNLQGHMLIAETCSRVLHKGSLHHVVNDVLRWFDNIIRSGDIIVRENEFYEKADEGVYLLINSARIERKLKSVIHTNVGKSCMAPLYDIINIEDLLQGAPGMCYDAPQAISCSVCLTGKHTALSKGMFISTDDKVILTRALSTTICSLVDDILITTSIDQLYRGRYHTTLQRIVDIPEKNDNFFMLQIEPTYETRRVDVKMSLPSCSHTFSHLFTNDLCRAKGSDTMHIDLYCVVTRPFGGSLCLTQFTTSADDPVFDPSLHHPPSAAIVDKYISVPLNRWFGRDVVRLWHCSTLPRTAIRDMKIGSYMLVLAKGMHLASLNIRG